MHVPCPSCGADLRLNPNLAGTSVPCPQCGAAVQVPAPPPRRRRAAPAEPPPRRPRRRVRSSLWLLAAQALIGVLGVSCLAGAFFYAGWKPPDWSYFAESPLRLVPAGIVLVLLGWLAGYVPIVATLAAVLLVIGVCAWRFVEVGAVDASRVAALSLVMLALWLALQHRRAVAA